MILMEKNVELYNVNLIKIRILIENTSNEADILKAGKKYIDTRLECEKEQAQDANYPRYETSP